MFKQLVEQLPGSEIFAIISLVLFFSFFITVIIMAWKKDKNYLRIMEQLPLDSSSGIGEKSDG